MILRYTTDGFLVIMPQDDCHQIVDAMLETGYNEEFCLSLNFEPDFIARLMEAGFLVMSSRLADAEAATDTGHSDAGHQNAGRFILLPKLHLTRSALFFENLHIKKSIKQYLNRFELRFDTDFDSIVDRCIAVHGDGWLTSPLVAAIRDIRKNRLHGALSQAYPASFALYQNGTLVAGEFGVIVGRVYTSYSGYYDVDNAGTVQLILTTRYLQEHGFAFFDLGMPLGYKTDLGAVDISPAEFIAFFRMGTSPCNIDTV